MRAFVTVISATVTVVLALVVWFAVRGPTILGDTDERPLDILIVVWEDAPAERLAPWGGRPEVTPWLAAAAPDAVLFEHAIAPATWSLPATAALLTGKPAEVTGTDGPHPWLDAAHLTVAEHFQWHHYATVAMIGSPVLGDDANVLQGFATRWVSHDPDQRGEARMAAVAKQIPGDRSQPLGPAWAGPPVDAAYRGRFKDAAPLIDRALLGWLDEHDDEPFLAWLNLAEAAPPRFPSAEARNAVTPDAMAVARGLHTVASPGQRDDLSAEEIEAIRAVHDASLFELDQATAALFDGLRERGRLDSTIVVLTSDHGTSLGQGGRFGQGTLDGSVIHVPLLVWHPDLAPERRAAPVSTRDLFGTLARLARIDVPPGLGDWWTAPSPAVAWLAPPPPLASGPTGHALISGSRALLAMADDEPQLLEDGAPLDDPDARAALSDELKAYFADMPALPDPDPTPDQTDLLRFLESMGYAD